MSDTGPLDDPTVLRVMQGYGVMPLEILEQLRGRSQPTHVMLQGGVGGLAAGVAGVLTDAYGADRPRFIVVEPETAACLLESVLRLQPAKVGGDLRTEMHMLATGEASPAAWEILRTRADAFVAIDDGIALDTTARLTQGDREALDLGVSGAAGLAGLIEIMRRPDIAEVLGLDHTARVLTFATDGAPRIPRRPDGDGA